MSAGHDPGAASEAAASTLPSTVALRGRVGSKEVKVEAARSACVEQASRWKKRTG
jgi:hypothetical protein